MATSTTKLQPYPAYRPSGVEWLGKIPAHWEVRRLRSTVTSYQNGVWGDESDGSNDIACVRVADFDRVAFRVDMDEPTMRSVDAAVVQARRLEPGDLLLEVSGGGEKQPVGAVVMYDHEAPAVCSNFIARMVVSKGFGSRFLTYLHSTLYASRINTRSIKQSIGIQNLDKASYLNETAGFPSLVEQRAIAAFLDRETAKLDALVAKKELLIELLQEKRTALISQAVTKGLNSDVPMRDSGVEWLGDIPAHWEVKRLKTFANVQLSNVDKKSEEAQAEVLLCNYTDVYYNEHISPRLDFMPATASEEQVRRFSLRKGDVLITKDSETWTDIAVPAVVTQDLPGVLCGYHLAHIRPDNNCDGAFLSRAFSAMGPRDQFHISANGITRYGLTGNAIRSGEFPVPPRTEQKAIGAFLDRETAKLDALVAKVREAIERLRELRTALIAAAVTGKIDVRETGA